MDFSAALPRRSLHSAGSIDNKAWEDALVSDASAHRRSLSWAAQAPKSSKHSELETFLSWLGQWTATSQDSILAIESQQQQISAAQSANQGVNIWSW